MRVQHPSSQPSHCASSQCAFGVGHWRVDSPSRLLSTGWLQASSRHDWPVRGTRLAVCSHSPWDWRCCFDCCTSLREGQRGVEGASSSGAWLLNPDCIHTHIRSAGEQRLLRRQQSRLDPAQGFRIVLACGKPWKLRPAGNCLCWAHARPTPLHWFGVHVAQPFSEKAFQPGFGGIQSVCTSIPNNATCVCQSEVMAWCHWAPCARMTAPSSAGISACERAHQQ